MKRRLLLALLALSAALGCGSPAPPGYGREQGLAKRARDAGSHRQAALSYERAARLAGSPRDAEEARYLAAASYARAGAIAEATALYRKLAAGGESTKHGAGSTFALARLELSAGDEAIGQKQLASAIHRYPGSALARRALTDHVAYLRETAGFASVLAYLDGERDKLGSSELGETLDYVRARELDRAGQTASARDAYLACARRFPYPLGAYWDDALYRAAETELRLGTPQQALAHLRRLLAEQEAASIVGSYERPRYAAGQFKIAEIYRDVLQDNPRARREFRRVWEQHPQSSLVDDALFEEALLARSEGDTSAPCAPLRILLQERANSRYAACAHLLCSGVTELAGRECHGYLKRRAGLE